MTDMEATAEATAAPAAPPEEGADQPGIVAHFKSARLTHAMR